MILSFDVVEESDGDALTFQDLNKYPRKSIKIFIRIDIVPGIVDFVLLSKIKRYIINQAVVARATTLNLCI